MNDKCDIFIIVVTLLILIVGFQGQLAVHYWEPLLDSVILKAATTIDTTQLKRKQQV